MQLARAPGTLKSHLDCMQLASLKLAPKLLSAAGVVDYRQQYDTYNSSSVVKVLIEKGHFLFTWF